MVVFPTSSAQIWVTPLRASGRPGAFTRVAAGERGQGPPRSLRLLRRLRTTVPATGRGVLVEVVTAARLPANRVFGGSVNPNGTPQETGFTVEYTPATHLYKMDFPPGTFSGNAGKFLLFTVTPIGTATVDFVSSIAPIAADGSGSFEVQFTADTLFTFVVAVQIA